MEQQEINCKDLSMVTSPLGMKAGSDIEIIKSKEQFNNLKAISYAAMESVSATKSGVYLRSSWVDPVQQSNVRTKRSARIGNTRQVPNYTTSYVNRDLMCPIYVVTLADGEKVAAMFEAKYQESDKEIVLPIGQKRQISPEVRALLAQKKHGAITATHLYYAYNDEWYEQNDSTNKLKAIGGALFVFLLLVSFAVLYVNKLYS